MQRVKIQMPERGQNSTAVDTGSLAGTTAIESDIRLLTDQILPDGRRVAGWADG
jgi:hypothetical protein